MGEVKYYDKLVRDKVPEIIREQGKEVVIEKADEEEYVEYLKKKLIEEVSEFINEDNLEELVDIREVLAYLEVFYIESGVDVHTFQVHKRREKGGFGEGFVLKEVKEKDEKIKN